MLFYALCLPLLLVRANTIQFIQNTNTVSLKARSVIVHKPRSPSVVQQARLRSLHHDQCEKVEWDQTDVLGPDVEDQHTLAQLARMTGNAYALPGHNNWYDIDHSWNTSFPIGYEDPANGFRGHVFLSSDNSTIILSIKGTTLQGPTSKKDKFNDNLLFSCCCARVDISWIFSTVCDCYARNWRCDDKCLTRALIQDSLFYSTGVNLINDLTSLHPFANIWLVGHSLGGALASLLASTFGFPAVAFESPGERLAATRLHLPLPPPPSSPYVDKLPSSFAHLPITHVYHTADPIPVGACTGPFSPCAQAGFALESRCHLGKSIVYDTIRVLGWRVDVRKHVIKEVVHLIENDIEGGWESDDDDGRRVSHNLWGWRGKKNRKGDKGRKVGRQVPTAREEVDCVDCYKWEFGDFEEDALAQPDSALLLYQ